MRAPAQPELVPASRRPGKKLMSGSGWGVTQSGRVSPETQALTQGAWSMSAMSMFSCLTPLVWPDRKSVLVDDTVHWRDDAPNVTHASLSIGAFSSNLRMTLDHGRLITLALSRWGNPEGSAFADWPFGAYVDQEATFGGYTIPARLRVGWHFDDPARFDAEGKFFEVAIDSATYR